MSIRRHFLSLLIVITLICSMGTAVFGTGFFQRLSSAAWFIVLGVGSTWMAIRSMYRGTTPASIGGSIQFSRSEKPFFFWFNCIGHLFLGVLSTVAALLLLHNLIR